MDKNTYDYNPGVRVTDYGAGSVMVLRSQCLRCADQPTECSMCVDACPVDAFWETNGRLVAQAKCLHCGLCVGVCPLAAVSVTRKTVQQANAAMLEATLKVDHVTVTCKRTFKAYDDCDDARRFAEKAVKEHSLLEVPCLAYMGPELWFSMLNEVGVSLDEVCVLLPPGQCEACPINQHYEVDEEAAGVDDADGGADDASTLASGEVQAADTDGSVPLKLVTGDAEAVFGPAIELAEQWAQTNVTLLGALEDVPLKRHPNVRAYLVSDEPTDRRGMFTGFFKELRDSWDEVGNSGTAALREVAIQRERREAFKMTRLVETTGAAAAAARKTAGATGKKPLVVPQRYILVDALGRNPAHADTVVLNVSGTDAELCTGCGTCVNVCPLHARHLTECHPALDAGFVGAELLRPSANGSDGDLQDEPPKVASSDPLYCMGCSACIQACPAGACFYGEICGSDLLLTEEELEAQAQAAAEAAEKAAAEKAAKEAAKAAAQANWKK
jgi:Fe-S-cluster-containing hydrogenase component 2